MPYKLPCSCGSFVPVETNQAGRSVQCQCGNSLQVPSLSQIKNLEPFSEQGSVKTQKKGVSPKSPSRWIRAKHICLIVGFVLFIIMGLLFVRGVMHYPQLYDVCTMNPYYVHDGKVIGRDTKPISPRDFRLIVDERIVPGQYVILSEDMINQNPFYDQYPIHLIELHDHLKDGLELSYNFHEKYGQLVFYYWARFVVFAFLTGVSLLILITGLLMPKYTEDIGERGGETWE